MAQSRTEVAATVTVPLHRAAKLTTVTSDPTNSDVDLVSVARIGRSPLLSLTCRLPNPPPVPLSPVSMAPPVMPHLPRISAVVVKDRAVRLRARCIKLTRLVRVTSAPSIFVLATRTLFSTGVTPLTLFTRSMVRVNRSSVVPVLSFIRLAKVRMLRLVVRVTPRGLSHTPRTTPESVAEFLLVPTTSRLSIEVRFTTRVRATLVRELVLVSSLAKLMTHVLDVDESRLRLPTAEVAVSTVLCSFTWLSLLKSRVSPLTPPMVLLLSLPFSVMPTMPVVLMNLTIFLPFRTFSCLVLVVRVPRSLWSA